MTFVTPSQRSVVVAQPREQRIAAGDRAVVDVAATVLILD
jgi:hypothetical protein